jgi:hypothetical protein
MSRATKCILILFALLLSAATGRSTQANTVNAASCNVKDVQAAINSASNGDTVVIPNGSCTWSSGIAFSKQITLQGASVDGVTITYGASTASASVYLLTVTIGSSFHTTIANLNFLPPAASPGANTSGYIILQGTGLVPLMHDMSFNIPNFIITNAVEWNTVGGVGWNLKFYSTQNLGGTCGQQIGSGSGSLHIEPGIAQRNWDTPSTMGTLDTTGTKNVYIEDSSFIYVGQSPDIGDSGRAVFRHVLFQDVAGGETHGTSGANTGRQWEIYDSQFKFTNPNHAVQRWIWLRGGTLLMTGNQIDKVDSGSCYGVRQTISLSVENAQANANLHGCALGNMAYQQPGSGSDGLTHSPSNVGPANKLGTGRSDDPFQISDPVYAWNNTGTGATTALYGFTDFQNSGFPNCNNINPATGVNFQSSDFIHTGPPGVGRDAIYCETADGCNVNQAGAAKPGWQRYPYPHPLRAGSSGPAPAPPTGVNISVK